MRNNKSLFANIDWSLVCIYLLMLFFGWLNIYAANYGEGIHDLMTTSSEPGKQLFWIGTSFIWILLIIILDGKFYTTFSYPIYILMICLLIGVLFVGKEIGAIAKPDLIQGAPGLPKTRSGKIMRRILRKIAEGEFDSLGDTSTLADPSVVSDLVKNKQSLS